VKASQPSRLRLLPEIGMVDMADPALPARLAGKMDEQLELFASQMRGPRTGMAARSAR
jgi:hypothetical protein